MRVMRLALVLAVLLGICVSPVFAQVVTATMGDQNSSGEYRLKLDSSGTFTYASDSSLKFPYQTGTTNDTLTAADSGRIYAVVSGVVSPPTYTLPTAAVGMEFTFVVDTATDIYLNPATADTIKYSSLDAGDALYNSSAAVGDSITIFCAVANTWSVKALNGTWADAGVYGD